MASFFDQAKTLLGRAKPPAPNPPPNIPKPSEVAQEHRKQGNDALARGDLAAAITSYRLACEADPHDPLALVNLGFGLVEQGQSAQAEPHLLKATQLDPSSHDAHYMLARARIVQSNWVGAKQALQAALVQSPRSEFAWFDLGETYGHMGELTEALDCYDRALLVQPTMPQAAQAGAKLAKHLDLPDKTLEFANRWIECEPQSPEALALYADALYNIGRQQGSHNPDLSYFEKALAAITKSLELHPGLSSSHQIHGNVLIRLGRQKDAIAAYQNAHRLAPHNIDAVVNAGVAYRELGQLEQSLALLDQASAMNPDYPPVLQNRGVTLVDMGRAHEAIAGYVKGMRLDPENADMRWNLACAYLLTAQFDKGWQEFEHRFAAPYLSYLPKQGELARRYWKGESLQGCSIILYTEQGLGDVIQFLRYLPLVAQQASRVLVWIPKSLIALAQSIPGKYEFIQGGEEKQKIDFECSLMSLASAFGMRLDNVPNKVPYLSAPSEKLTYWQQRLGSFSGLRIGLVWSGSVEHKGDKHRSIALQRLRSWVTQGVQFVSLQKELRASDVQARDQWPELLFFGDELQTFADTAALIAQMDLVISVDTSVAHLAGALGKPLWIMIPFAPDWRWMYERTDTPWYPTAKLYRQDASRSWEPVVAKIQADFMALLSAVRG